MSNFVEIKNKDGVTLGQLPVSSEGGRLRRITVFNTVGTHQYAKPDWLKFVRVRLQGAGGGGAGTPSTSTGQFVCSGHGGGGGYAEKLIAANGLAVSETVTIGAGGVGGAAGQNDGGTGGTTSFGTHCSATGATGGTANPAVATTVSSVATSGIGGSATGGDINVDGWRVPRSAGVNGNILYSGGASSAFGSGGMGGVTAAGTSYGHGAGGCGATALASTTARAGTDGRPGLVILEEYE
jgi:hypothetical protein